MQKLQCWEGYHFSNYFGYSTSPFPHHWKSSTILRGIMKIWSDSKALRRIPLAQLLELLGFLKAPLLTLTPLGNSPSDDFFSNLLQTSLFFPTLSLLPFLQKSQEKKSFELNELVVVVHSCCVVQTIPGPSRFCVVCVCGAESRNF